MVFTYLCYLSGTLHCIYSIYTSLLPHRHTITSPHFSYLFDSTVTSLLLFVVFFWLPYWHTMTSLLYLLIWLICYLIALYLYICDVFPHWYYLREPHLLQLPLCYLSDTQWPELYLLIWLISVTSSTVHYTFTTLYLFTFCDTPLPVTSLTRYHGYGNTH